MERNLSKRDLRGEMKARRRAVTPRIRASYSAAVCRRLLERDDVRRAIACKGVFAVYIASRDEIDLSILVESLWSAGCKVVVPAWRGETYRLVPWASGTVLVAGPMGIPEPKPEGDGLRSVEEGDVSVWVVPGLAFSRPGARLGYGGGWYDRFLSRANASSMTLGVAYPFQVVERIPQEPHDRRLTDVVYVSQAPAGVH